MARFKDAITEDTWAIRRVRVPIANGPMVDLSTTPDKADIDAALAKLPEAGCRILNPAEQETVYEKALARAKSKGGDENSTLYNLALQLYTIALAYVDPDSDPCRPVLFFGKENTLDSAVEMLENSRRFSRDVLAYLAEQHETWNDHCNPQGGTRSESEMMAALEATAKDAAFPLALRPGERLTLLHTGAVLLVGLLNDKSTSSSPTKKSSTDVVKRAEKPKTQRANSKKPKRRR